MKSTFRQLLGFLLLTAGLAPSAPAQNLKCGGVNDDATVTVRDSARVVERLQGTTPLDAAHAVLADATKDGAINQADVDEIIKGVGRCLWPAEGGVPPPSLSRIGTVRFTSPASGEGDVSVNRETIVHFTFPSQVLAANPQLVGTEFTVPANSLFSDDGLSAPLLSSRLHE